MQSIPDQLTARLAEVPEVRFALLFGSRAGSQARPDSDWDVAVYLDETLTPRQTFETRRRLLGEFEDLGEIDLVVLNEAPALLGHRALQGERLFVRDPTTYVRYFVRTMANSEDERYWHAIHDRARLARIREGRFGRS